MTLLPVFRLCIGWYNFSFTALLQPLTRSRTVESVLNTLHTLVMGHSGHGGRVGGDHIRVHISITQTISANHALSVCCSINNYTSILTSLKNTNIVSDEAWGYREGDIGYWSSPVQNKIFSYFLILVPAKYDCNTWTEVKFISIWAVCPPFWCESDSLFSRILSLTKLLGLTFN